MRCLPLFREAAELLLSTQLVGYFTNFIFSFSMVQHLHEIAHFRHFFSVSLLSYFWRLSVGKSVRTFAWMICEDSMWTCSPHGFFNYWPSSVEHKCTVFAHVLDNWKSKGHHVRVIAWYMIAWPHALCRDLDTRGLTAFSFRSYKV